MDLKRYKSADTDKIPAELIKAEGEMLHSKIHNLLIITRARKNCYISGRNLLLYLVIKRAIKLIVAIVEAYHHIHTKHYPPFVSS
jgi:hypothetical protein